MPATATTPTIPRPTLKSFWSIMWNPQRKSERICVMLYWVGVLLVVASALPFGTGTVADQRTEGLVLTLIATCLYMPMIFEAMWYSRKLTREIKREMNELMLELKVHEILLKILDPEAYAKAMKEIKERHEVAKLFNAKTGPKEG